MRTARLLVALAALAACAPAFADHRVAYPVTEPGTSAGTDFAGASADGSRVFFVSAERLVDADADDFIDIYVRTVDGLALATPAGEAGDGADAVFPQTATPPITPDGLSFVFQTAETLTDEDFDGGQSDLYLRTGGETRLVTKPNPGGFFMDAGFFPAVRIADDASRVAFQTIDQVAGFEFDLREDVFEWDAATGSTALLSGSSPAQDVDLVGASPDLTKVFM